MFRLIFQFNTKYLIAQLWVFKIRFPTKQNYRQKQQHHQTYLLPLLLPHMLIFSVNLHQHHVSCLMSFCRKLFHLKKHKQVKWNRGSRGF